MAKRRAKKHQSAAACKAAGGTFVHFKTRNVKFCAKKKRKGGKRGKKGVASMSTAARKAMVRKACRNASGAKRQKMKGLCNWANR